MENVPISERSNTLTSKIDKSKPKEMLKYLRQSDSQIFCGYQNFPSLSDSHILKIMQRLVDLISNFLMNHDPNQVAIIFSGSGTSGRLSWFCSNQLNQLYKKNIFHYTISGGDK